MKEIGDQSQTSVIQPNTNSIKPSILLDFDPRNQIKRLGVFNIMVTMFYVILPTNNFKSYFYVNDIKATVNASYYVSDVTKF